MLMLNKIVVVISSLILSASSAIAETDTTQSVKNYENAKQTAPKKQADNIWNAIPQGFALKYDANQTAIQKQKKLFSDNPAYIKHSAERAKPYLQYIYAEIKKRNLPTEIALLPIVESQYDPFARSYVSAVGIWQLMPATAQRFGANQNWWFDGRRDIHDSTKAALDYIEYLHGFFDGNWLHVLAAYNAGEGTLRKAIRKNKSKGKSTEFWALDLPKETRAYVPKILALAELMKEDLKGLNLPKTHNLELTLVKLDKQIDLALAATHAGLSLDEIYTYNPGFNHWATPQSGPHKITLPKAHVAMFKANLQKAGSGDWVKSTVYEVQSGDSLDTIAKTYAISTDVIKQANNLKSARVSEGTKLVIPASVKSSETYAKTKHHKALADQSVEYTVKNGDSLWKISQSHDISIKEIAAQNNLKPSSKLKVGQKIVFQSGAEASPSTNNKNATILEVQYTVRSGDSLKSIANRFRVEREDILSWNNLKQKNSVKPGQEITVYVKQQTKKV